MRIARYAIPDLTPTGTVYPVKYTVRKINSKNKSPLEMSKNTHQYEQKDQRENRVAAVLSTNQFHSPKYYGNSITEPEPDSDNDSSYGVIKDKCKGSVSTLSTYGNDRMKRIHSFDLKSE